MKTNGKVTLVNVEIDQNRKIATFSENGLSSPEVS